MSSDLIAPELTPAQFETISRLLYQLCGIDLRQGKEGLVQARLAKRLRALGLADYDDYIAYVRRDASGRELVTMIDVLTTNKTSFFREPRHFDFLCQHVVPQLRARSRGRIWSAGCSSGEEPYTIALVLRETLPDLDRLDIKILATDISTPVLARAREATYEQDALAGLPSTLVHRYFTCVKPTPPRLYRVNDNVRALVRLARLNLMEPWPMKGPFDVIFCRNVVIYFDKPTQQKLVRRFWKLLRPGGFLFVGHSESLTTASHEFRYVQPAVYLK